MTGERENYGTYSIDDEASVVLIMVADPKAVEENIDRMLDSWLDLGYMKPDMRDTYKGMANNLYGTDDSRGRSEGI